MKRLIGMMLVMVVGCGVQEDIEPYDIELGLVRNENGEVIEFTRFPETDADLEQLRDMPELETLTLYCNNITDPELAHLKELTNLQSLTLMGYDNITDAGLAHLKGLTNLQSLDLIRTQICLLYTSPSPRD